MATVYVEQILDPRYIKDQVLLKYLSERKAEFGEHYSRSTDRNTNKIVLKVKRPLTSAEILEIQKTSYPQSFADYDSD